MDGENGGSQPCAMCRHRRKRCGANCEFAPLFPGNRYEEFQHAVKLYNMRKLKTLLRSVEPQQRKTCAESILAEANAWRDYPSQGCLAISSDLTSQINSTLRELQIVHQQLAFCKGTEMNQMDNSVFGSSSACNIPPQSGQLHDLGYQKPCSDEMPSEHTGEKSDRCESVQIFKDQGESSSVSEAEDKGKKIADE